MTDEKAAISALETIGAIVRGETTAEAEMRRCIRRIQSLERQLQAFVDLNSKAAIEAAKQADAVSGQKRGPLHGLPVAVKAVFDVAGMRCDWGTAIHGHRVPNTDAAVVSRLKDAGAIVVGTTVSTEYAIAAAGPTRNPFDPTRTPGGSSSGSAAAVASGMVPAALGSQTVGSVVRPSIYCGVFGLKPTRGAMPKRGGMVLSPRLDHPGVLARTPDDVSLLCQVLFARDDHDPDSIRVLPPGHVPRPQDLRVLTVRDWPPEAVSPASLEAQSRAEQLLSGMGARVEKHSLPDAYAGITDVLYTIMTRDMALAHGQDRDRAGDQMSAPLRDLIDQGRAVTDSEYERALATADGWRGELCEILGADTVMLSPATQDIAPLRREGTGSNRQQALWSLVGLPVIAVPTGLCRHMPIGVQIGAGPGQETLIIAAARTIHECRSAGNGLLS